MGVGGRSGSTFYMEMVEMSSDTQIGKELESKKREKNLRCVADRWGATTRSVPA